jgi:hypothetical protein
MLSLSSGIDDSVVCHDGRLDREAGSYPNQTHQFVIPSNDRLNIWNTVVLCWWTEMSPNEVSLLRNWRFAVIVDGSRSKNVLSGLLNILNHWRLTAIDDGGRRKEVVRGLVSRHRNKNISLAVGVGRTLTVLRTSMNAELMASNAVRLLARKIIIQLSRSSARVTNHLAAFVVRRHRVVEWWIERINLKRFWKNTLKLWLRCLWVFAVWLCPTDSRFSFQNCSARCTLLDVCEDDKVSEYT